MKKAWIIAGVIAISTLAGCSPEKPETKETPKKNIAVTVDTQKTIQEEIAKLKENLVNVPVANIEGSARGSINIETEIGTEKPVSVLMATDVVKVEGKTILVQYMATNQVRESLKGRYVNPIKKSEYLSDEEGNSIGWEKNGWSFELIPSEKVSLDKLVSWAETFEQDEELVSQVSEWFSLDDVTLIKDVPGENVKFFVGMSTMNPNQKGLLHVPNKMYAMIQSDMENISSYQINHSVEPKDSFDYSLVKSFKEIDAGKKKAWYNQASKELYWEDDKFVYHLQDNALQTNANFFDLEDYRKFANLK